MMESTQIKNPSFPNKGARYVTKLQDSWQIKKMRTNIIHLPITQILQ